MSLWIRFNVTVIQTQCHAKNKAVNKRGVNSVENQPKDSNINIVTCEKTVDIKENQSFNESNLMTLPFISLKRKRVPEIKRVWFRDGREVELKVIGGSEFLCPTIYELDVLMALFKIQAKNMDNKLQISNSMSQTTTADNETVTLDSKYTVTNMPKVIHFTYRGLAKEMGFKNWGSGIKKRLENSIKCLNECTIYSTMAIRDQEIGDYIVNFDGVESSRILKNYKAYNVTKWKKADKKLLHHSEVVEYQSVEIDDFFFKNLCNNFLKLYDYSIYKQLKMSIAKKMQLILTQWSHGYEKYIKFQTLCDYIGLDNRDKDEEYYNNQQIKKALEELKSVGFIQDYYFVNEGVNFIFNVTAKIKDKGLDKYTNDNDIVARLWNMGISNEDISKYCRLDTMGYVGALLRYVDYRYEKGYIKDIKKFTLKGLPYGRYDVSDFMLN